MSKSEKKIPLRDSYLPLHMILGGGEHEDVGNFVATREIVEMVPILSDSGTVLCESPVVRVVPAHEPMAKFKYEDFRLEYLLAAGVPLTEINFELCSRNMNNTLVAKAINLGLLSEEFSPSVVPSLSNNQNSDGDGKSE